MNNLSLYCNIRKKSKQREQKNIKIIMHNLVERDYDNIYHNETILSTDVHILMHQIILIQIMCIFQLQ